MGKGTAETTQTESKSITIEVNSKKEKWQAIADAHKPAANLFDNIPCSEEQQQFHRDLIKQSNEVLDSIEMVMKRKIPTYGDGGAISLMSAKIYRAVDLLEKYIQFVTKSPLLVYPSDIKGCIMRFQRSYEGKGMTRQAMGLHEESELGAVRRALEGASMLVMKGLGRDTPQAKVMTEYLLSLLKLMEQVDNYNVANDWKEKIIEDNAKRDDILMVKEENSDVELKKLSPHPNRF